MSTDEGGDVLQPVYRITTALRWVVLVHALVIDAIRLPRVAHPVALVAACVLMALWTAFAASRLSHQLTRTGAVVVGDVAVTLLLVATSTWVLGPAMGDDFLTVPVIWTFTSPIVVAVWRGRWWALLTCAGIAGAVAIQLPRFDDPIWHAMVALALASFGVGAIVDTVREVWLQREASRTREVALAERDRLNRIVHDGALQVLVMVEREGPSLGPRGAHLAELAREQEVRLRAQLQDRTHVAGVDPALVDLAVLLERHVSGRVVVSVAGDDLLVPRPLAEEVDAAVNEALANVRNHAGPDAHAWLLVEDEPGMVVVSVRDNGVGSSHEDLRRAAQAGRLGVQQSIVGRIEALGGTAEVRTGPGKGLEWELRVPVEGVER